MTSSWLKYFQTNTNKLRIEIEKLNNDSLLVFSLMKPTGSIKVDASIKRILDTSGKTALKNDSSFTFSINEESIKTFKPFENKQFCNFENLAKNIALSEKSQNEDNCLFYILSLINKKTLFDTSANNAPYIFFPKDGTYPPIVKIKSLDEFIENQEMNMQIYWVVFHFFFFFFFFRQPKIPPPPNKNKSLKAKRKK